MKMSCGFLALEMADTAPGENLPWIFVSSCLCKTIAATGESTIKTASACRVRLVNFLFIPVFLITNTEGMTSLKKYKKNIR